VAMSFASNDKKGSGSEDENVCDQAIMMSEIQDRDSESEDSSFKNQQERYVGIERDDEGKK